MIEQVGVGVAFYAHFVASKTGKTGLTVTVDVWRITEAGVATEVVTGGSATEIGDGLYRYGLSAVSVSDAGEYVAVFKTADSTVDAQHLPALWAVGRAGVENLDATVSTRLPTASYTAAPTAETVADAILDDEEVSAGVTVREALALAGSSGDPLTNPVGGYVAPQAGYYIQRLAANQVRLSQALNPTSLAIELYYGDDYSDDEGREISFTSAFDLSGAGTAVTFSVRGFGSTVTTITCEITGTNTYQLLVSASNIEDIGIGTWDYDISIVFPNGHTVTEVSGIVRVKRDIR